MIDTITILRMMEDVSRVLDEHPKNVLELLKAMKIEYNLKNKKALNRTLYDMEKNGDVTRLQPNPNDKPEWVCFENQKNKTTVSSFSIDAWRARSKTLQTQQADLNKEIYDAYTSSH